MGSQQYYEPASELSPKARALARVIASLRPALVDFSQPLANSAIFP
jgi:hypothetical protein